MSRMLCGALCALVVVLAAPIGAQAADPPHVVISEFGVGAPEFVELVNVSSQTVDLSGWKVDSSQCAGSPLTADATLPSFALAPGQHFLLAHGTIDGDVVPHPDYDLDPELGDFVANDGGVLVLSSASGQEVDRVGYGTGSPLCAEGAAPIEPTIPLGQSAERKDGGHQDTQDNAADFAIGATPHPQNSTTIDPGFEPPAPPPASSGPMPPPPPAPVAPPGAKILGATLSTASPAVGQAVTLRITAQDPGYAPDGVTVDDGGKQLGTSSCQLKPLSPLFAPGATATYALPLTFTTPGVHHLAYSVLSGGCDGGRVTQGALDVTVKPAAGAASLRAHAARKKKGCKNANVLISAATMPAAEKAILCLLNRERAKQHLRGLKGNALLRTSALFAANDMVTRHFFAHVGPGGPGVVQRLRRAGYRSSTVGENIGLASAASPAAIVAAWIASPPHRANILYRGFRYVGIGIVLEKPTGAPTPGDTFVTDFGAGAR